MACNILVHGPVRNRFTDIFGEKQQNIWKCKVFYHSLHKICSQGWMYQVLIILSEFNQWVSLHFLKGEIFQATFFFLFFLIAWLKPHCVYPQHPLEEDCNQSPHPEWSCHTSDVSVSQAVCLTVHNHAARRAVTACSLPYKTEEVFKISLLSIKIFTQRFNSLCWKHQKATYP